MEYDLNLTERKRELKGRTTLSIVLTCEM